ncbi:hypothetical protein PYCC9005_004473 [Savitreella phatthalungensis]
MWWTPAWHTKHYTTLTIPFTRAGVTVTQDDQEGFTGGTVWGSAQVLAAYVVEVQTAGKRKKRTAIELGAGTGVVSIVAGGGGWKVWATDVEEVCEMVLRRNVAAARAGTEEEMDVQVVAVDWQSLPQVGERMGELGDRFDYVLASDVIYAPTIIPPFIDALVRFGSGHRTTTCYIAQEVRDPDLMDTFVEGATEAGFKVSRIPGGEVKKALMTHLPPPAAGDGDDSDGGDAFAAFDDVVIFKLKPTTELVAR